MPYDGRLLSGVTLPIEFLRADVAGPAQNAVPPRGVGAIADV